jgi:hypothetical protein
MQAGIFRLGLPNDWNVRVRIFPEGKKLSISKLRLDVISGQNVGSAQFQLRQGTDRLASNDAGMIENFMKLSGCRVALLCCQIRLASQVNWVENKIQSHEISSEFVGRCVGQGLNGFTSIATAKQSGCVDRR